MIFILFPFTPREARAIFFEKLSTMTDKTARDAVPRAVQACHELLAWLIPQLDLFPRARRFTLGERLESGLLRVLEALVE